MIAPCAEELALSLAPAAEFIGLTGEGRSSAQEAIIMLHLNVKAKPDRPGLPFCEWCGRTDPPAHHLEITSFRNGKPVAFTCTAPDITSCVATRDEREPGWLDHQFPDWGTKYTKLMDARRREQAMIDWQKGHVWGVTHPDQIAAWEKQLDPDALAAVRLAVENKLSSGTLELAAADNHLYGATATEPATGIYGPDYDQGQPLRSAMLWDHTLRNPANRMHTLGHQLTHRGRAHEIACMPVLRLRPFRRPGGAGGGIGRSRRS